MANTVARSPTHFGIEVPGSWQKPWRGRVKHWGTPQPQMRKKKDDAIILVMAGLFFGVQ